MPGKIDLWKHPVSGRWYVTWSEGVRSRRVSTRERDRRAAERFRAAFVLERDRQPEAKPDEVSVTTLLDSYYERHAKDLPSGERANIAINHLSEFYGAATVSSVNARTHERYIAQCTKEGLAPGTVNQHLTRLRAALRFAVKSGDLTVSPHVPSLQEPPPRADVLTRRQVAALLRAAKPWPHVALFIRLALYTGARHSAILQLTWDRVDLKAGTVDFRLPNVVHSRKRRAITGLPARLVASLRRLRKRQAGDRVIQYDNRRSEEARSTRPIKSIKRAFANAAKAAKLPHVTPHILKHTAVSLALRVVSPWSVSGMTATSIRTLQAVYGKHMVDDLKAGAEAVAQSGNTRNLRAKPKTTPRRRVKKRPGK